MATTLEVLELYSGIGGMHFALREAFAEPAGKDGSSKFHHEGAEAGTMGGDSRCLGGYANFKVVAAVDINTVANRVYQENFGGTVLNRQIQSLSVKELTGPLRSSLVTMSPPCQPFTRQGNQRKEDDPRTASFFHLLSVLPQLGEHKPKFIFLENVKGFEGSPVCDAFLECLEKSGFVYLQCLVSPHQFNVPNSRLRYYCMGIEKSRCCSPLFGTDRGRILEDPAELRLGEELTATIENFIDRSTSHEDCLLNEATLAKNAMVLDIVYGSSQRSCCFTKNYGRYMKGTGSVVAVDCSRASVDAAYSASSDVERLSRILALGLRLFSPREVASLMCFPETFRFPEGTTLREAYHLLGNSINVRVVAALIRFMLSSSNDHAAISC